MGVAIGSSMQIALLVTPFLVILGWIIGQPMTLHFETFETVVFFLSVLVVTYVIQDGTCKIPPLYVIHSEAETPKWCPRSLLREASKNVQLTLL